MTVGMAFLFLALGTLLASPYLLPIVESLGAAHNKNAPFLAFIPMPTANLVSFFVPLLFGQPLQGWLEGPYPEVADWNNLFCRGATTRVRARSPCSSSWPGTSRSRRSGWSTSCRS